MTQFNLADELRRGGTGLIAQAVANLRDSVRVLYAGGTTLSNAEWLEAMQARAAAVPAGNQASAERIAMAERLSELEEEQAPTALDEMRALQEGAAERERPPCGCLACDPPRSLSGTMRLCSLCGNKRCPHCENHRYVCTGSNELDQLAFTWKAHTDALVAQLDESREALARVEAERDRLDQMLVVRHLELRKRDAVIEAARKAAAYMNPHGEACRNLRAALSALDQAASEAEVAERAIVVGSTWECEPDQHCDGRHVVEDIEPREAPRKALIGFKCRGVYTAIGERTFRADHAWVSDPEGTPTPREE